MPIYEERIIEKIVEVPTTTIVEKVVEIDKIVEIPVEKIVEVEKIVDNTDNKTLMDLTAALDQLLKEVENKNNTIHKLNAEIEILREESSGVDEKAYLLDIDTDIIGPSYPINPNVGQLFILVSQPNNLYKWNGDMWILVDKNQNTGYTDNINWKHWQLGRLQRAEIEFDDMTNQEQAALETLSV